MNRKLKTKRRMISCLIAAFVMAAAMAAVTAYAADSTFKFTVKQVFTASSPSADAVFTYRLKALEPGSPMPSGSTPEGYTFTITGNGSVEIGPLTCSQPGVYRYELFQVIAAEKPGYTYDKRVYTIEANVDTAPNARLVVKNKDGTKADEIKFENSRKGLPSDPGLMADLPVKKTVSGTPSQSSVFTFKLVAKDSSYPMPAGSTDGVKTIQITDSGKGEFGTWSHDKEGVYHYTVSEVNAGEKGYTYDTTVYTITDTVKEANGQLTVSRVVTNDANKPVSSLDFINRYSTGDGPKMGDEGTIIFAIIVFVTGIILVVGATVYLIAADKRKKTR